MLIAHRLSPPQIETDAQFQVVCEFLEKHRETVDEIALFDVYAHGVIPLEDYRRAVDLLTRRMHQLRERKFPVVGYNVRVTIGHLEEGTESGPAMPFEPMVGHDGTVSRVCACPNGPRFREYNREKYRLLAAAKPDFIWVDDDMRLNYTGVAFACFCPICLEIFGKGGSDRAAFVDKLNSVDGGDLRLAWIQHNGKSITSLLADIKAAVRSVSVEVELGLMTNPPDWGIYSGSVFRNKALALGATRWRPGGGFWNDRIPQDCLEKALEVGRQCLDLPAHTNNIQFEMENFPHFKLDKSVQSFLNECLLSLATGCNGIALDLINERPGALDDYDDYVEALRVERPHWERYLTAADGSPLHGVWPAFDPLLMGKRDANGNWFAPAPEYDTEKPYNWAVLGVPLTLDPQYATAVALSGRVAETFSKEELEKMLSGGVLLDSHALEVLWEKGVGELTGVRVARKGIKDAFERLTDHPLNGGYAGACRDVRPAFWPIISDVLEPIRNETQILSESLQLAGNVAGPCTTAFQNAPGGRVVTFSYAPWELLGSSAKRNQLLALADWASRSRLPLLVEETRRVAPLVRRSADGKSMAALLFNASSDPTGPLTLRLRGSFNKLEFRASDWTSLSGSVKNDETTVTSPSIPPWTVAILLGNN